MLGLFDQSDTNTTTGQRTSSTVPLQSLFLMNNPWIETQSSSFAQRIVENEGPFEKRLDRAYNLALGRNPSSREVGLMRSYVEPLETELSGIDLPEVSQDALKWKSVAKVLLTSNEFLYVE